MSTARDVIVAHKHIGPVTASFDAPCLSMTARQAQRFADDVLAALRESRTVRTVEELDALPEGTLIAFDGHVWRNRDFCGWWRQVQRLDGGLCNGYDIDQDQIVLPVRVLYRPDEDGDQ